MDVAEELPDVDQVVDRAHVERRSDDWRSRVRGLDADIQSWLSTDRSMADGDGVGLLEDLMIRFQVPLQTVPSKLLVKSGRRVRRVEPRGSWIVVPTAGLI